MNTQNTQNTQNNMKARSLALSLFEDLDIYLPQHSRIHPNAYNKVNQSKPNKYVQNNNQIDEFDLMDVQLAAESKITTKINQASLSGSSSGSTKLSQSAQQQVKSQQPNDNKPTMSKIQKRRANKNEAKQPQKKEVDIDAEIGQVAEWAERKTNDNMDDEQNFDKDAEKNVENTQEQVQIKRKLEEKLRNYQFGRKINSGQALKAKADELRKLKEEQIGRLRETLPQTIGMSIIEEQSSQKNNSSIKILQKSNSKKGQGIVSLSTSIKKTQIVVEHEEQDDDPWDRINQQTLNKYQQQKYNKRELTLDLVVRYYKQQFTFNEEEVQQIQQKDIKQYVQYQKEIGCCESLFSCFKQQKPHRSKQQPTIPSNNNKTMQRLIAISQKQLTNTNQQFFMLKNIWTNITEKPFNRYGHHWNQVGFQGRDPATDLRSTGVLSLYQWMIFAETHKKITQKYFMWTLQHELPFALTHIKVTALFLVLIKKGVVKSNSWEQLQKYYNALAYGTFKKLMEAHKDNSGIGTLVEDAVREMKLEYKKYKKMYDQECQNSLVMK